MAFPRFPRRSPDVICDRYLERSRNNLIHADYRSASSPTIFVIIALLVLGLAAGAALGDDQLVTDSTDVPNGNTLRAKIAACQSGAHPGGTITFNFAGTILLDPAKGALPITANVTIDGGATIIINGGGEAAGTRIFLVNVGATLTLKNITISQAYWTQGDGAAVRNLGTLNVSHTKFFNNQTTPSWSGAAIYSVGPLNISDSEFANNSGGGGIVKPNSMAAVTTITASRFHDNHSSNSAGGGYGGAMQILNGAPVTITDCTFNKNMADTEGGGIYVGASSTVTIAGSAIYENSAAISEGGGITSAGILTVRRSTIATNTAQYAGGIEIFGGQTTVDSCTISANDDTNGNGLAAGGVENRTGATFIARNSIISGNTGHIGPAVISSDVSGTPTSQGYNLVGSSVNGGFTATGDQRGPPNVGPLQDNGGPTWTMALALNSLAIDNGNAAGAKVDQRGFTRIIDLPDRTNANGGDGSDIGAFEFGSSAPVPSPSPSPSPSPTPTPSHSLGNISTRGIVGIGDEVMIGGFTIAGTGNKTVLLRAIGPSLRNPPFNLTGTLQDPTISLFNSSQQRIGLNNNWADADNAQSIDPGLRPSNSAESAILITLAPGAYTAIVSGADGGTGIGLVEIFDLDATVPSKLSNISTRGLVETGDNVLIGGLSVKGTDSERVVVRAIGPSLADAPFNLTNVLQNPTLSLFNDQGTTIQSNDDWQNDQRDEIVTTGLQPSNPAESVIVRTLLPGNYTAIVTGVNGTTGVALVEVYERN
jgi:hypothetical protein